MKGRPVRGLIGGFFLGLFLAIDLVFLGAVNLNSVVVTILPIALMVLGLLLGLWAPLGRGGGTNAGAPPSSEPVPATVPEQADAPAAPPEDTPPI